MYNHVQKSWPVNRPRKHQSRFSPQLFEHKEKYENPKTRMKNCNNLIYIQDELFTEDGMGD